MKDVLNIQKIKSAAFNDIQNPEAFLSIEDRFIHHFSNMIVESSYEKSDLKIRFNDSDRLLNPLKAIKDQEYLLAYTTYINTLSTVVRKGTAAVETLLRA